MYNFGKSAQGPTFTWCVPITLQKERFCLNNMLLKSKNPPVFENEFLLAGGGYEDEADRSLLILRNM
jgi:hypothetical protein